MFCCSQASTNKEENSYYGKNSDVKTSNNKRRNKNLKVDIL